MQTSAHSVFAADVDSDGDLDVVSGSFGDDTIAWYENDGAQRFTARSVSTSAAGVRGVFAADIDGDGDTDVLGALYASNTVAWYENDGSEDFTARTISTAASGAHSVFAADMDGDGDHDVVSASRTDNKIAWYENDGSQSFTPHTITTAALGANSVFVADVDGDGDLDVLSASQHDDKIAWYERLAPADFGDAPLPYPTLATEDGAHHVATGLTLGTTRDIDAGGTPSPAADADGADEDGVTFGTVQIGALDAAGDRQCAGRRRASWTPGSTSTGDGSWGGPGEQIVASRDVAVGDNALTFDIPGIALAGTTYARFRLSTVGGLGVGGAADDGEVEDYQVTIGSFAAGRRSLQRPGPD